MEVRIGVIYTARELVVETDGSTDEVSSAVEGALSSGDTVLWLTDTKGRRVGVPTDKIAFVEIVTDAAARKVGFGSS
jgi:hypothetical protein